MTEHAAPLNIEIFSDVICPWCFIGKRRLDRALQDGLGDQVTLRWRPYQLQPGIPEEGLDRLAYLQRRYGPDADSGRAPGRIAEEARSEGIELRYDLIKRMPNTLQAHRLLEFAHDHGRQHDLAEALFVAYFCRGQDVGDEATLLALGVDAGLDGAEALQYLDSGGGVTAVAAQLARAPEIGISGVPGSYLADSFLLPGAQTSDVMAQIIGRVRERLSTRPG
jgi:predicted DsbA family dithiol-disulfide isomerase